MLILSVLKLIMTWRRILDSWPAYAFKSSSPWDSTLHTLSISHLNCLLSFLGIGGRTVSKTLSFDLDKIKAFQPRVIILELGTNDLCVAGQRPETIGSDMERLVQQVLHEHCGAVFIMVCLVIYRSAIPPHVPDFSHQVDLLINILKSSSNHSLMPKRRAIKGFRVHLFLF